MRSFRLRACAAFALVTLATGCAGTSRLASVADADGLPAQVELAATPFHAQTEHQCGPAALATLLGAVGQPVSPEILAQEIYVPGREGSFQPELVAALRTRGLVAYELRPDVTDLMAEVAGGRPVLVLQRLGAGPWPAWHFAVVVGYDAHAGTFLLRSGTEPRLVMRAAQFAATWERADSWAIVALEPGTLPARPDLTRYVTAAAGLEATGRLDDARAAYVAAMERWPGEMLPRLGLANVTAAQGRWAEAEQAYRAVLAVDPRQAVAINNRAHALLQLGCARAAMASLEQGEELLAPGDPMRPTLERTRGEIVSHAAASASEPTGCSQFASR